MKHLKKSRQNLAKLAEEVLNPHGFSRHGTNFLREKTECFQIIQLQGSRYNSGTYVNQMVWFKSFGTSLPLPIGSDFHFSTRMESAIEADEPYWIQVLDATGEVTDRTLWKQQVAALLEANLPVFDQLLALPSARENFLTHKVEGLFLHKALQGSA